MYQNTKNIQKIKKIKKQSYDGFFESSGISSKNLKSLQIEISEKIIKIRERKKEIREIKIKIGMYYDIKNIQKIKKIKKQSYDGFFESSGISSKNLKSLQIEISEKIIKIRERKKEIREIKIKIGMYYDIKNIQKIKKIKKQSYDGFFESSGISSQNSKSIQIEIREKIIKIRERK